MSKSLNGAILHNIPENYSIFEQVIKAASLPNLTRKQIDEAIDNCELLNAQITDAMDLIADAVVTDDVRRLNVGDTLNLLASIARLNNGILTRLAWKLLEGEK